MNTVAMNTPEPPFAILPNQINIDPNRYYKTTRDTCYWNSDNNQDKHLINEFIIKAREFNYTEDQALAVLVYNNYDYEKSECDLKIYRPVKGLAKVDIKHIVKLISDGIGKTVKSREHRDFDAILSLFPGFTIGDVLGVYSKHRFLIKKQTYRIKKSIKKSINKPYVSNGCLKENETSWNELCLDTQFQGVYQKHHQLIQNCSNIQDIISRDLSEMRQSNRNGFKIGEFNSYAQADGILNLLKKMNRKKNKSVSAALDKTQLLNILNTICYKKSNKIEEDITSLSCLSTTTSTSPNAEIISSSSTEPLDENNFEDKLYDYVKGKTSPSFEPEEDAEDQNKLTYLLQTLFDQHETVLRGFQNCLINPNEFQQLSHSWNNMDFAILLLGLSEYGKNFRKISDAVFTKSESMVQSFYLTYNTEFNLNDIIPVTQSCETEVNSLSKENIDNLTDEKVNIEECITDKSEVFQTTTSITSPEKSVKVSKKKSPNKSKSAKTSKNQSPNQSFGEENQNLIVTRSHRNRLETKEAPFEVEKKSFKKTLKKNLKRKSDDSCVNFEQQGKSSRRI